ncbi:MAG: prolyl-tRNA synthetase associated domain-containing protein [Chloroflexota bacterium]
MITSEKNFLDFLDAHRFIYQRIEHPAVFTCAEAELHRPDAPAVSTKNLFLCDKKGRRFFLAVTACETSVNLESLALQLGVSHLRFGSEENLQRLLGVTRGSVTMMGLANDAEHKVELWMDAGIWQGEYFLSHPLVNTATLILSRAELERFFDLTGHNLHLFNKKPGR